MLNLIMILLLIAAPTTWALSPNEKMPNLIGQTYHGEWEKRLKTNNFNVTLTVNNKLMRGSSGVVISQIPAAGENLPETDQNGLIPITLTISPVIVEVPNVKDMTYSEAQAKLYSVGLTSARFIKITESGSGMVLDQFPATKTQVATGTKITLTVAQTLPLPEGNDGCTQQGEACTCSNTGWERHCNYGPHRKGLYCQCD